MKRTFKIYILIWLLLFIVFNVCAFVIPSFDGKLKFDNDFYISYAIIVIVFIIEMVCGYKIFNVDRIEKVFINLPIAQIGYCSLLIIGIVGVLSMVIPGYPVWLSFVLGILVICVTIILIVVTSEGINYIEKVENKIKNEISIMKESEKITKYLYNISVDSEIKKDLIKLYEEIKYTDSVSTDLTNKIDIEINERIKKLQILVEQNNTHDIKQDINNIILFIKKRKIK